jgi:hypothetical protein
MVDVTPLAQNAPSKRLSFNLVEKKARFRREVPLYSGVIIEKSGCLPQISFAEWQSSQQIRLTSAEFRGGIKCDRRE